MNTFETLQQFENLYETMHPAQQNNKNAFAWFSGIPHPLFNAIMHFSCEKQVVKTLDSLILEAPKEVPISFWNHSQNKGKNLIKVLNERGFHTMVTCSLMEHTTKPITSPAFDIRPANLDTFSDFLAKEFQFNRMIKEGLAKLLTNGKFENYFIYEDDKPIATGTFFSKEKIGGIFNISILLNYQKKGYGKGMMQFLMKRAYELEVEKLILLSEETTEKFYQDLEFKKCLSIEMYALYPKSHYLIL